MFRLGAILRGREGEPPGLARPARFRLAYERRTEEGLGFTAAVSRAGREYNPGLGFEMREDFMSNRDRISYGWLPGEKSWLQSHSIFGEDS